MELRHLRYFIAVAEELRFARAAERLHIEQSPLSRAIKDLEYGLGARLLERSTRSTRLTWAGQVFLVEAKRVLAAFEHAKTSARSAASGFRGIIRIAVSDGISPASLSILLAKSRLEEPEVSIRLFEVPLAQQLIGLRNDLYDAGFACGGLGLGGISAVRAWEDPLVIAIPARHPLLVHRVVPLAELLKYPLVVPHPELAQGARQQIDRILRGENTELIVAECVANLDLMIALVAAGYGPALVGASMCSYYQGSDVAFRPIDMPAAMLNVYLLQPDMLPSEQLQRFIARLRPASEAGSADEV